MSESQPIARSSRAIVAPEYRARRDHPRGQDRGRRLSRPHSRSWSACFVGSIVLFAGAISPRMAQLDPALREKGIDSLTVVNTPIERARLYFRYHPMPNLLAAADPERASHRAFGLPNLEFTENETVWPYKVSAEMVHEDAGGFPANSRAGRSDRRRPRSSTRRTATRSPNRTSRCMQRGTANSLASSCWTGKASSAGALPKFRKADKYMFGAPSREELMSAASQVSQ